MRIVVLGWGSLCWDPRELRIRDCWHSDGPSLPVEFARVSISRLGSLTLVLLPRHRKVRVLWSEMDFTSLDEAIKNLGDVEGTTRENIGWVDLHNASNKNCHAMRTALVVIKRWARRKHVDSVVWTDLPTNFLAKTGKKFNSDNVVNYLISLHDGSRREAEKYVRRAPRQIRTKTRKIIEDRFGWTHVGEL